MANTRIIRPIPIGPVLAPAGAVLVDGNMDYIVQGIRALPLGTIYAATLDNGEYTRIKSAPIDFVMRHNFAGWAGAKSVEEKAALVEAVM